MHQHVKLLGMFNIVYGSIGILIGLIVFVIMGGLAGLVAITDHSGDADAAVPILGFIGVMVLGLLAILSAPAIIAGVGLLYFKPWARVLTIVLSALHLLSIPFGTALGVYGLWVLLKPESEILFRRGLPPAPNLPTRPYA